MTEKEGKMPERSISEKTKEEVVRFHGHWCPGLALGIRAAEIALREVGHSSDEEIVAVVETDMCGVDAIQFLTGCTFGKGNLLHRDYGKNAFTFFRRSDGKAVRIATRPGVMGRQGDEIVHLREKMLAGESLTPEEEARMGVLMNVRSKDILDMPEEALFRVQHVPRPAPRKARIMKSILCETCGEPTMETRTRRFLGQILCIPCFEEKAGG